MGATKVAVQRTLGVVNLLDVLHPESARRAYRAGARMLVDRDGGSMAVLARRG